MRKLSRPLATNLGMALLAAAMTAAPAVALGQPTPSVMQTGRKFYIQSAQNYGRNNGGYWDIPGRPKLIDKGSNIQIWDLDSGPDRTFTLVQSPERGYYEMYVGNTTESRVDVSGGKKRDGTNVGIWERNGGSNQRFLFRHLGGGRFKIYDRNGYIVNLKNTNAKNGNNVQIWHDHDGIHNEWYLLDARTRTAFVPRATTQVAEKRLRGDAVPEGKKFYIQSAVSHGRNNSGYWDLPGGDIRKDATIQIWSLDGGQDRLFRFQKRRDSEFYQIYVGNTRDGVVDVAGGKTKNGTNVQVWTVNNGSAQDFYLEHLGNGRFKIHHRSGKIVNLKHSNDKNGNNVHLWDDHNAVHCEWYLIDPATKKPFVPGLRMLR